MPIEAIATSETIAVPESLVDSRRDTYVLRVRGDSMIDEQIRDGDWVVVEDRKTANNGEMVVALLGGSDATLKKFYREAGRIRLQPANPTMQPIFADPQRADPGRRRRRDAEVLRLIDARGPWRHRRQSPDARSLRYGAAIALA